MTKRVSVVLATYNRPELLERLLGDLSRQTIPAAEFEVIVVDDGSTTPVRTWIDPAAYPFALSLLEQPNAGQSAARNRGVGHARGEILVLLDDDMELAPGFLAAHLAYHAGSVPTAVFGRYVSDPDIHQKPIFERYLGMKWDQLSSGIAAGRIPVDGTMLATGNTSMRRQDYLRAGGLDPLLRRAEDMALGLALEELGIKLVFSETASSVHRSDTPTERFRQRVYAHGRLETVIARRHPTMAHADPWRHAFSLPLAGRVLCVPSVLAPRIGEKLAGAAFRAAEVADRMGFFQAALKATGLVYGLEYFRGMRDEAGSLSVMVDGCLGFIDKAARADRPTAGLSATLAHAIAGVRRRVRGERP